MRFQSWLLVALAAALSVAACGPRGAEAPPPDEAPPPSETPDAPPSKPNSGFLTLRPPAKPDQRPPEPPKPLAPRLVILHDGAPLPDAWLKEWKGERALTLQQRALTAADATLPADAGLVVLAPHRLGALLAGRPLLPLAHRLTPSPASPLFLHHPYDPGQQASLPFRWTPYVLYRKRENAEAPFPPHTITWQAEEGILWPEPPAPARAFWLKSQGLSANAPLAEKERAAWTALESSLLPVLQSPSVVWTQFLEGKATRCWLPAAFRFRLSPEQRTNGTMDWIIPAHGTVIHLDLLAIPSDAPQADAALELAEFLTSSAIQERLAPETGWLPVNRPIGKESSPSPLPLPAGDWLDKSEIPYPDQPFPIAQAPSPPEAPDATPEAPAAPPAEAPPAPLQPPEAISQ
jgi:predicted small lipoprotein YifL